MSSDLLVRRLSNENPAASCSGRFLVDVELSKQNRSSGDIATVRSFWRERETLAKCAREGMGLEVLIADARMLSGIALGKWFLQLRDLYAFCKAKRCHFVISSGAASPGELVSGACLDAILKQCGIDPAKHWSELVRWLEATTLRRGS